MDQIAQLKIPGSSAIVAPSNVPQALRGGDRALDVGGAALLNFSFNWVFALGIFAALVVFMWGGVEWISSQGDSVKIARAKKRILFAIIGTVVIVLAFFIVRTVIFVLGGQGGFFRI